LEIVPHVVKISADRDFMIDTNFNFRESAKQAAAFQKIWMESWSKGMQAACTLSPAVSPSEVLTRMRSNAFAALTESWEEFMRTPQFLTGVQKNMEHLVMARKNSNDLFGKLRNEFQSPSREDIDTIMVSVRHIESRLLDRVADLEAQVEELNLARDKKTASPTVNKTTARKRSSRSRLKEEYD